MDIPLTEEQKRLAESGIPYARWYAYKFSRRSDRDEAEGLCMSALVVAAAKYDPAVGTTFPQFASVIMKRALIAMWRAKKKAAAELKDDVPARVCTREAERLYDWLSAEGFKLAWDEMEVDILEKYLNDHTLAYIARKYGFLTGDITRWRDVYFERIRKKAARDGVI